MKKFTDNKTVAEFLDKSGGTRWAGGGGFPLMYDSDGVHVYKGEGHSSIIGVSGTGKSQTGSMPLVENLLDNGESVCAIDPKGEIARRILSMKDQKYQNVRFVVFDMCHPVESLRYNPMALAANYFAKGDRVSVAKAEEICDSLAYSFMPSEKTSKTDPYWNDATRTVLLGIISMLCNLGGDVATLRNMCGLCSDGRNVMANQRLLSGMAEKAKAFYPRIQQLMDTYTGLDANRTSSCIQSQLLNCINDIMRTNGILEFTDENQFDVTSIDPNEQICIFIIVPMNIPSYYGIAGIMLSQISDCVYDLAQRQENQFLPVRFNFVIEELGNIGRSVPNLPFLMSASRSSNIRMHLFYQSMSQLEAIFGSDKANIIRDNVSLNVIYRVNNLATAKYFSEYCGTYVIPATGERAWIIEAANILSLDMGQALVIVDGKIKFVSRLSAYGAPHGDKMPEEYISHNGPSNAEYSSRKINMAINEKIYQWLDTLPCADIAEEIIPLGHEVTLQAHPHLPTIAVPRIRSGIDKIVEAAGGRCIAPLAWIVDEAYISYISEVYDKIDIDFQVSEVDDGDGDDGGDPCDDIMIDFPFDDDE